MKKLLIVLSALTVFASCKKEGPVAPLTTVTPPTSSATKNLVKCVYQYDIDAPETDTYSYDAQGRISEFKDENRTTTFNYVSATLLITTERKNADNSIVGTKDCEMNANGYITKMTFKDPAGYTTYVGEYTYNADGYIIKQNGAYTNGYSTETVYTIVDGNVVSSKIYYDNNLSNTVEYAYDNTKLNKTAFSYTGYWQSYKLFGKRTKNLVTEVKYFNAGGTITYHSQSTYETDADGYYTKQTVNYLLDGKKSINTFTYQ